MDENKNQPAERAGNEPEQPPKNIPPEITAVDETNTDEQLQTTNYKPETEQHMEVHHHPHPAHGKKTWKEYFWEFLMLFLAVFCGFLAEYQLEQIIEKHREKELVVSLIEDLKRDTTALSEAQKTQIHNKILMDSLIIFLTAPDLKQIGADVYYYGRKPHRFNFFKYTDRTIQQLKNAGSFRLIKNTIVADSILKYYSLIADISDLQNVSTARIDEYIRTSRQLFNPLVFETMVSDQTNNQITKPAGNPPLLTYERNTILNLISIIHNLKSSNRALVMRYIILKKEAEDLIKFLKNEYRLE